MVYNSGSGKFSRMLLKKIIFLIILIFASPCFAQTPSETLASPEPEEVVDREAVRNDLYYLYDLDNREVKKGSLAESTVEEVRPTVNFEETDEAIIRRSLEEERRAEAMDLQESERLTKERKDERRLRREKGSEKVVKKWGDVFKVKNTSYVISLFEGDPKLMEWLGKSPEPLFSAISAQNMAMIRFISENGKVYWHRGPHGFTPEQFAIIGEDLSVVDFFLRRSQTNRRGMAHLSRRNVWGENLFHAVFYGKDEAVGSKMRVMRLLFSEEYFPKISHLLNSPNKSGQTPLDFAFNDAVGRRPEDKAFDNRIVDFLLERGAISIRNPSLSGYRDVYKRKQEEKKKKEREKAERRREREQREARRREREQGNGNGNKENRGEKTERTPLMFCRDIFPVF